MTIREEKVGAILPREGRKTKNLQITGDFLFSAYSQNEPFSDSAGFKMVGAATSEP